MSPCWHRQLSATRMVAKAIYDLRIICIISIIFGATFSSANPLPGISLPDSEINQSSTTVESLLHNNTSNSTTNDLYVIRAVVYEIGILTDANNSTNETTERHEEINLSFYDPPHKEDGLLDLSGIPVLPQVIAATTDKNE